MPVDRGQCQHCGACQFFLASMSPHFLVNSWSCRRCYLGGEVNGYYSYYDVGNQSICNYAYAAGAVGLAISIITLVQEVRGLWCSRAMPAKHEQHCVVWCQHGSPMRCLKVQLLLYRRWRTPLLEAVTCIFGLLWWSVFALIGKLGAMQRPTISSATVGLRHAPMAAGIDVLSCICKTGDAVSIEAAKSDEGDVGTAFAERTCELQLQCVLASSHAWHACHCADAALSLKLAHQLPFLHPVGHCSRRRPGLCLHCLLHRVHLPQHWHLLVPHQRDACSTG